MARTFEIRPATREGSPVIMGLTGPSGSGKTLSALRLAHGMQQVTGGDIGMIDTEGQRAKRYADNPAWPHFKFKHLDFQPPFASVDYIAAIDAVLSAGCKTIVIDSMSHEHEGPGGYLELHETEIDRMLGEKKNNWSERKKMTWAGWIKPAGDRRKLINAFLQRKANFIFCFRAKEKIKPVSGGEPVQLGWQAIAGDEFVYEMVVRALLLPGCKGVPDWSPSAFEHGAAKLDDQDKALFPAGKQLSEEIGRNLALACGNQMRSASAETMRPAGVEHERRDVDPKQAGSRASQPRSKSTVEAEGYDMALRGSEVLRNWFSGLPRSEQAAVKSYLDDTLKNLAADADQQKEPSNNV